MAYRLTSEKSCLWKRWYSSQYRKSPRGRTPDESKRDKYQLARGSERKVTQMVCLHCGETPPVKSNQAIAEETRRIGRYLHHLLLNRVALMLNATITRLASAKESSFARLLAKPNQGSPRYRCKACHKTFSVKRATSGQKQHLWSSHKDRDQVITYDTCKTQTGWFDKINQCISVSRTKDWPFNSLFFL